MHLQPVLKFLLLLALEQALALPQSRHLQRSNNAPILFFPFQHLGAYAQQSPTNTPARRHWSENLPSDDSDDQWGDSGRDDEDDSDYADDDAQEDALPGRYSTDTFAAKDRDDSSDSTQQAKHRAKSKDKHSNESPEDSDPNDTDDREPSKSSADEPDSDDATPSHKASSYQHTVPTKPSYVKPSESNAKPHSDSCASLTRIFNDMNGPAWSSKDGWDAAPKTKSTAATLDCCTWYGVTCKGDSIVGLDLGANSLSGPLSQAVFSMPGLQSLNMSSNSITGALPDSFGSLLKLKSLSLHVNNMTGSLPPSLTSHATLSNLHLSENAFTGDATFVLPALANLFIDRNYFNSLHVSNDAVPNLIRLTANDNELQGTLQDFSAAKMLQIFSVAGNNLTGPIFPLTGLTNLTRFDVRSNSLSGGYPPDLSPLTSLSHFLISSNQLSGPFPSSYAPASLQNAAKGGCTVLPNRIQGVPPKDIMNDPRSLAAVCGVKGNSAGPQVNVVGVDGGDGLNETLSDGWLNAGNSTGVGNSTESAPSSTTTMKSAARRGGNSVGDVERLVYVVLAAVFLGI